MTCWPALGQELLESLGQPVIVENSTGCRRPLGADFVATKPMAPPC